MKPTILCLAALAIASPLLAQTTTPAAAGGAGYFRQYDKNGDGKVTTDELPNKKVFDRFDADKDGSITAKEYEQVLRGTRPRPTAPSPPPAQQSPAAGVTNTWFRLHRTIALDKCQAAAVFDLDGDGTQDIVMAGSTQYHLLRNRPGDDGPNFETATFTVPNPTGGGRLPPEDIKALSSHDYNLDGRLDLYLCSVLAPDRLKLPPAQVLINQGSGAFKVADIGINSTGSIRSVLSSDYDGDGYFDTFHVCSPYVEEISCQFHAGTKRWDRHGPDIIREIIPDSPHFWLDEHGIANKGFKGAIVRDVDGDGRTDILLGAVADVGATVRHKQRGWLRGIFVLRNVSTPGKIRFEDVSNTAIERAYSDGSRYPQMHVYTVIAADIDRDGDLDLFVTGTRAGWADRALEDKTPIMRLLRNDSTPGRIKFADITKEAGLDFMNDDRVFEVYPRNTLATSPNLAAAAALDVENDGHVDVFNVVRATGFREGPHASFLWKNDGQGRFQLVRGDVNGVSRVARDLSYGDLDDDGRVDLVLVDGSAGGGQNTDQNYVYLNSIRNSNHWVKINVTWPENPFGLESKVTVFKHGTRNILGYDEVRTDFCYRSRRSPTLHFGLGPETAVDVRVKTRSGGERVFQNLQADQLHTLRITLR